MFDWNRNLNWQGHKLQYSKTHIQTLSETYSIRGLYWLCDVKSLDLTDSEWVFRSAQFQIVIRLNLMKHWCNAMKPFSVTMDLLETGNRKSRGHFSIFEIRSLEFNSIRVGPILPISSANEFLAFGARICHVCSCIADFAYKTQRQYIILPSDFPKCWNFSIHFTFGRSCVTDVTIIGCHCKFLVSFSFFFISKLSKI